MSGSIRLSPKHGVNPSIGVCFWCGEENGCVMLPGMLKEDREAPRRAVWDKAPCEKCKGYMTQGVLLISVRNSERDNENPYRTGGWAVVRDEAVGRMFTGEIVEQVLRKRVAFVPDEVWDMVGLPSRGEVQHGVAPWLYERKP